MKKIRLKKLHLVNFMGEKERTTEFNLDETTIAGANGLGKSRHFNAFMWLLFGKDVEGRKDYEIRTRVGGEPLHEVECSVEAEILVDDEIIDIKRSFVEDWVKPRGCAERILKGNHTDCWWNGAPVKVGDFDKRIAGIIDASLFRMITDPMCFPNMPWKKMRGMLFELAGNIDESAIINGNPEFVKLMDIISGKSYEDFKKELAAKKKRLNDDLNQVQPRIDQTQKMMPESCDFASIERRIADIDKEITTIDKSIADAATAERAKYDRERALQSQVNDIRRKMDAIINDAQDAAIADARKANAERDGWNNELRDLHSKLSTITIDINRRKASDEANRKEIERQRERIARLNDQVDTYRNRWKEENRRPFTGDKCPHCGQPLPPDMLADAETTFRNKQTALKDSILADANAVKAQIAGIEKDIADLESLSSVQPAKIAELEKELTDTQARIDELNGKMQSFTPAKPDIVVPGNIPAWKELNDQVADLERQIAGIRDDNADNNGTSAIAARKAELNAERSDAVRRLSDKDAIDRANKEIADLEKHGKDVAQDIADLERLEFTMAQFSKRRVEEMEKRVNSLFTMVTWKLFDYTFDGNESETCIPMVNGVPFGRANTASRINAGLDIINALCRHFDVCAPIFLDNAECINEPIKTAGQVIKMYVTTDQTLIIK